MHVPSLARRLHGALVFLRLPRPCLSLSCDPLSLPILKVCLSPPSCSFLCFPHSLDYLTHSRGFNHHLLGCTHLRTYPSSLTLSPAPWTTHLTASWTSSPRCSTDQPPRHNMSKTEVLMSPQPTPPHDPHLSGQHRRLPVQSPWTPPFLLPICCGLNCVHQKGLKS